MPQALLQRHWLHRAAVPLKFLIFLAVSLIQWGKPVGFVDAADAWPLGKWLSGFNMNRQQLGDGVAAAPYLFISQVVSHAFVRVIIPDAWSEL